jgi:biopolymer transport protein ExbD
MAPSRRLRPRPRRRALSLTSLIDVIFLLLLFFMLSSTFTRFAELSISGASTGGATAGPPPHFLRLGATTVAFNGVEISATALPASLAETPDRQALLISMDDTVTAQRLTDILVILRAIEGLAVTVLE